jgi:hypothetical protein
MPAKTYREWALGLAPAFLRGNWGEDLAQGLGTIFDMLASSAVQGLKASKLTANSFPMDALRYLASERRLPRYAADTDAGFRSRLSDAWNAWLHVGTEPSIVGQFEAFGITCTVWQQGKASWDWDDDAPHPVSGLPYWSRFWIVLTDHDWTDEGTFGDPGYIGDGGTIGSTATPAEVATVRKIAKLFKPGFAVFQHVIVVLDESTWNGIAPVTTGDRYDVYENRTDAARYWDGVGKRADN